MRSCLVFLLLAACELVPAPKQAPPPPTPASPPPQAPQTLPADAAVAPVAVVAPDAMDVTDPCLAVGVKVSDILIAEAADASERNALEQQRATIVRRTAEACTTQKWSDDLHKCVGASKKKIDLQECEKKYMPKPPAEPPPKSHPENVPPTTNGATAPKSGEAAMPKAGVQRTPLAPKGTPKNGDPNAIRPKIRPKQP